MLIFYAIKFVNFVYRFCNEDYELWFLFPEKVFYLNSYDFSYSNVIEKVLGPSSEIYDKLVKGLTNVTVSPY